MFWTLGVFNGQAAFATWVFFLGVRHLIPFLFWVHFSPDDTYLFALLMSIFASPRPFLQRFSLMAFL